eukprot:4311121-Prymnesium_polylepis.1
MEPTIRCLCSARRAAGAVRRGRRTGALRTTRPLKEVCDTCTASVNLKFTAASKFSARRSFSDLSSMAKGAVRPLAAHVQVLVKSF